MWDDATIIAMVPVRDVAKSKEFYGQKLGLHQLKENPGGVAYECGGVQLFTYRSDTAGSSKATCFTLEVADVEAIANDLKAKGVPFESYDLKGSEKHGDVYVTGQFKAAWFKDPDGNIIGLGNKLP